MYSNAKMKVLKPMDISDEEKQLRLLMSLRSGTAEYQEARDKLHRMIARKTLDYYCKDGYYAFYKNYKVDYTTDDGYTVCVREHSTTITLNTEYGTLTGSGSTWDYIFDDLTVSPKPKLMPRRDYEDIRQRMYDILVSEKVVYP
ncbi:MAG: hypothetical protein IK136_00675, partial [Oscillospiraceae bacterium]|nr:hypothetical protein [Oscillospiraceae bacterium]